MVRLYIYIYMRVYVGRGIRLLRARLHNIAVVLMDWTWFMVFMKNRFSDGAERKEKKNSNSVARLGWRGKK